MAGFLRGFFGDSGVRDDSGSTPISRAISQSASRYGMYSTAGVWDTDQAVNNGWEKVLWVFRAVDAIAANQSKVPMKRVRGDLRDGETVDDKKLNQLLNIKPNSYETAKQFRYRISALSLLTIRGVFIEIVGNPLDPDSLHIIPPQSVEPIPGKPYKEDGVMKQRFVDGYLIRDNQGGETVLEPERVIWLKAKPHPVDPYKQSNPLVSAGIAAETDYLARVFNRNFLANDGRPGLLVSVRGKMGHEDAAELKARFGGGPAGAGRTTVIEGEGLDVVDLSSTPRDAQWQEVSNKSKEDLLLAFGVPESILGNASGRTFDNADAEYEIFWVHTMVDHCDAIAAAFDVLTGPTYDTDRITFDYSTVDVLQRHEQARKQWWLNLYQSGGCSWDEMRVGMKMPPSNTLAGRVVVHPSGFAFTVDGKDMEKIMELPNVNAQPNPADALGAVAQQGARLGVEQGARNLNNVLAARAMQLSQRKELAAGEGDAVPFGVSNSSVESKDDIVDAVLVSPVDPDLAVKAQIEAALSGMLIGFDTRQEKVCIERLSHAKVRKGTRHWEDETKAARTPYPFKQLDPLYVVEVDRWEREMRDDFEKMLTPILRRQAQKAVRDLKDAGGPDARPDYQTALREALDTVSQAVRTQSTRIAKQISSADEDGKSIDDMKKSIQRQVGTRSSWRKGLAEYVAGSAVEGVKEAVYRQGGKNVTKTWWSEEDDKVRASHRDIDGTTVKGNELFHVGNTMMRRPGDPLAPVEEVANCRCWLEWSVSA